MEYPLSISCSYDRKIVKVDPARMRAIAYALCAAMTDGNEKKED